MIRIQRIVILLIIALNFGANSAEAQNSFNVDTRPTRGFMPTADQLGSPVDSIEPVSGKLHLSIPLASLPRGRAGLGFDLSLEYDSHLYDLIPEILSNPDPFIPPAFGYIISPNMTTGGWHYNIDNLKIDIEEHPRSQNFPDCEGNPAFRVYRLRVGLLDGSLHTMQLKGYGQEMGDAYTGNGYFGVNPLTGISNSCARVIGGWPDHLDGVLTYYSTDGSYLRLEITPGPNRIPFEAHATLYFPDGRRLVHQGGVVTLYDANNNGIHFTNGCYDELCTQMYRSIFDDTAREIRIDYDVENIPGGLGRTDRVTAPGPNGLLSSTVNWTNFEIGLDGRTYTASTDLWSTPYPLHTGTQAVKFVQMPLSPVVPYNQAPPVWNSFEFGYADDTDGGYGEVDSVRTPTGSLFQYRYTLEGASSNVQADFIARDNAVRERKVTHDGITDLVWTYSYDRNIQFNTTVTNPDQSQMVYWYGPGGSYLNSSLSGIVDLGMQVYRIDEPGGNVRKRVWSGSAHGEFGANVGSNPWVRRETTTIPNVAGTPALTAVVDRMIDENGNLLQTVEYDWVNYNPSDPEAGTVPKRVTHFQYYAEVPDATSWAFSPYAYWLPGLRRLDAVRRKEVSGSSATAAVTEFSYDNAFQNGNVISEMRWDSAKAPSVPGLGQLSAGNSQVLNRLYGAFGNLTDMYEPEIRTHITYDPNGNNPVQVDYAYGTPDQRSWGYVWNSAAGTLQSKTDLNNNVTTSYTYDAAGRVLTVNEAGLRRTETVYDDANLKVTVKKDLALFGDGKLQATTQSDQLGRSVLTQTSEPGNPDGIQVKSAFYPTLNRTVHSSPFRSLADATLEWTCTQMDSSKRVTAVAIFKGAEPSDCGITSNRTGITQTVYDSNQTKVTDPAGNSRAEFRDGLGRLVQVNEDPSSLNYVTNYQYDALNNLVQTAQVDGSITQNRTFNYSSLGRLMSSTHPESGTSSNTYFDSGDLASRADARGIVTSFTYDGLHRLLAKSYSGDGGLTSNVSYTYFGSGAASPSIGQLQSVTTSAATVSYGNYDALGRAHTNTQLTNGNAYTSQYSYRLNDGLSAIQYPSGKTLDYQLDDAGRVNKVSSGSKLYADLTVSSAPFSADGRIAQMKLGNDLWETRVYQTPGTPTLLKLGSTAGGNDKLELEYDYSGTANNGNLVHHVIRQAGHTWAQSYSYDSLGRIWTANETGGFSRTYGYDRFGNRWVASSSGITAADFHEPPVGTLFNKSNNRLANQSYDPAGNLTSYEPRTMTYDAENRLVSANSSSNGNESFVYDGDGRRVRKVWTPNGGATQVTTYVYGPTGHLLAEYTNQVASTTGTSWMFTDLLGSVRAITGEKPQSGNAPMTECYDYLPFGRMLSSSDNSRNTGCYPASPDFVLNSVESPKFTGQQRDVEIGLDYFGARYLSAAQGRFTSSDPSLVSMDFSNPQSLNRYAYAGNNPLTFVDKNGKWPSRIHSSIIDGAFGGLTPKMREVMNVASERVDGFLNGGQTAAMAYQHGMRGLFEKPEKARQRADDFIYWHETAAKMSITLAGSVNNAALSEFGTALHTVTDRTSPTHKGEQLWTGGGEPGIAGAFGPAAVAIKEVNDGARALIHSAGEMKISLAQYHDVVNKAREEYLKTFGEAAFLNATGCRKVAGCPIDDRMLPAGLRK